MTIAFIETLVIQLASLLPTFVRIDSIWVTVLVSIKALLFPGKINSGLITAKFDFALDGATIHFLV